MNKLIMFDLTAFHVHYVIRVSRSGFVESLTPGTALQSPLHNGKLVCNYCHEIGRMV